MQQNEATLIEKWSEKVTFFAPKNILFLHLVWRQISKKKNILSITFHYYFIINKVNIHLIIWFPLNLKNLLLLLFHHFRNCENLTIIFPFLLKKLQGTSLSQKIQMCVEWKTSYTIVSCTGNCNNFWQEKLDNPLL